jgi:hypothetical protein
MAGIAVGFVALGMLALEVGVAFAIVYGAARLAIRHERQSTR